MTNSVGRRIFLAHMELSYRLGRRVTLAEFGQMIARQMGRPSPFTPAAVSRWESGTQLPGPPVIEAIAALARFDPGWISHGDRSAAPAPARVRALEAESREEPQRAARSAHRERVRKRRGE